MKKASRYTFVIIIVIQEILRELKIPVELVDEGLVAKTMLDIYENQSIILEPAGALSISGL
jgi:threonine dehydratase